MTFAEIRISQQNHKDLGIESLRGLAIFLVVAFHVIGYSPANGIHVSEDSFWRYLTYTLEFVRLPLFVAISGFVYALKPLEKSNGNKFLPGKARRLLLPFLTVSTLQFVANTYCPGTNNHYEISEIWKIYLFPWAQFWYLQAMVFVFVAIYLLERASLLQKFSSWAIILLVSTAILTLLNKVHHSGPFSIWGSVYLFPFFLLGLGVKRFSLVLFRKDLIYIYIAILIAGLIIQQLHWFRIIDYQLGKTSLITTLMSFSIILLLFRIRKNIPLLSWLGFYSYGIYLFHVFPGSGSRIFLTWIGLSNQVLLFVIGMVTAILLPILFERIITPYRWPKFLLLGLRLRKYSTTAQDKTIVGPTPAMNNPMKMVS